MSDDDARLVALESRLAHQEQTIEELNEQVFRQGQSIERLYKDVEQMARMLRQALEAPEEEDSTEA